jgi:hypothetical protein
VGFGLSWRPLGRPCSWGFGCISVASGVAAGGFAFTASHFCRRPKVTKTLGPGVRPSLRLGFLRSGIHPGASPTVCFAAPPLDAFGFAKRSLRSHPRINPSTQPAEGASRSRAAAELALILLSGAALPHAVHTNQNCRPSPARDGGLRADQSPPEHTQLNCGSWLASEGGLTADQSLAGCMLSHCRSEPARDGGLGADQSPTEHTQSNCRSEPARDGGLRADQSPTECTQLNCGSWLASEGGLTADQSPTDHTHSNCRSEPARDGGLRADQSPTEHPQSNCGSGLAREGGVSFNTGIC